MKNSPNKIKSVGTTKWKDLCLECGKLLYPEVRKNALNGIGISMGKCKRCKLDGMPIVPARDWMYRAGVFDKLT